jgi:hypothetical protein
MYACPIQRPSQSLYTKLIFDGTCAILPINETLPTVVYGFTRAGDLFDG